LQFLYRTFDFSKKDKKEIKKIFLAMPFLQFSKAFFHKKLPTLKMIRTKSENQNTAVKLLLLL
jgi:hypothetical protein